MDHRGGRPGPQEHLRRHQTRCRESVRAVSPDNSPADLQQLRTDAPAVVRRYAPGYEAEYRRRGWQMLPTIERVYVNELARAQLGWQPRYDFNAILRRLSAAEDFLSPLARAVGSK